MIAGDMTSEDVRLIVTDLRRAATCIAGTIQQLLKEIETLDAKARALKILEDIS